MIRALLVTALLVQVTGADVLPLEPHLLDKEVYSEVWAVILDLDDGTAVMFQQAISNIGPGDERGMCRLLVMPGDEPFNKAPTFGRDAWSFTPPGRLEVGPCFIDHAGSTVTLRAEVEGGLLEAVLDAGIEVTRPPGHEVKVKRRMFAQEILVRGAAVSGTLQWPMVKSHQISGHGCIYHYWVTAFPDDFASVWVRAYGFGEGGAFWILAHRPPGQVTAIGSIWTPGDAEPRPVDSLEIVTRNGRQICIIRAGQTYELILDRLLYRDSPLEDIGWLGFLVRPIIGNPVTRTYSASLSGPDGGLPRTVIVEISTDG